jgi:hypothetical protein
VIDRKCILCGCTPADCRQCIKLTGKPCTWVKPNLCSACAYLLPEPAPEMIGMALHRVVGAEARWKACAARGALDADLKDFIRAELGIKGYSGGPGVNSPSVEFKGGQDPEITVTPGGKGKKKLGYKGARLLRAVRLVLGIGLPSGKGSKAARQRGKEATGGSDN